MLDKVGSAGRTAFADAAVVVLMTPADGKAYELVGKDLPAADYTVVMVGAPVLAPWSEVLVSFHVAAGKGTLFDDGPALSKLTGSPAASLKESVAAALNQVWRTRRLGCCSWCQFRQVLIANAV